MIYIKNTEIHRKRKGSVLPLITVVLILAIILGAANFALVVMYRDRAARKRVLGDIYVPLKTA